MLSSGHEICREQKSRRTAWLLPALHELVELEVWLEIENKAGQ